MPDRNIQMADPSVGFVTRKQVLDDDAFMRRQLSGVEEDDFNRLRELADAVGVKLFIRIAQAVCRARQEHPVFGYGPDDAMKQVKAEMLEWEAQASLVHRPGILLDADRKKKSDDEAFDVIATLVRWIGSEFDGPVNR